MPLQIVKIITTRPSIFHTSSSSSHAFTYEPCLPARKYTFTATRNTVTITFMNFGIISDPKLNGTNDPYIKAAYLFQSILNYTEAQGYNYPITKEQAKKRYYKLVKDILRHTGAYTIVFTDNTKRRYTHKQMSELVFLEDKWYASIISGCIDHDSCTVGLDIPEQDLLTVILDSRYVFRDFSVEEEDSGLLFQNSCPQSKVISSRYCNFGNKPI